jgi:putative ATP-dependent endonuclease of the OLD family
VRLAEVEIEGYRCLERVTLTIDELTILLGSNSAGKSSVLKAMQFFFEGSSVGPEDVFDGGPTMRITVQATFTHLSFADRAVFGMYAAGEQMVLRRTWDDGETKLTGRGLKYPGFDHIRAKTGVPRRSAYKTLREAEPELELPDVSRVEEANESMLEWEMNHPQQCEAADTDATHLFGFPSVAQRRLSDRFKFVFVPGLQDAADEAVERRGTILERLLTAIADQRAPADEDLARLEAEFQEKYADVVERSHRATLDDLAVSLGDQMRRYVPSAQIQLEPVAQNLKVTPPLVRLRGGEERHLTDLGRQGHGFQRTFIIAALEYLAADRVFDQDPPTLFLAIEEPELYQHPPRATHFAETLRNLAFAQPSRVQVCYATHSPYFVSPSDFGSVRICRRRSDADPERASPTVVNTADQRTVSEFLPAEQRNDLHRRLARTLRTGFREAFFARAVLLVEGETDVAVFTQAARMTGSPLAGAGVVVAPVTKSVLPIAYAILTSLGIPTYLVFDGDRQDDVATGVCATCGRGGRDPANDAGINRRILETVGAEVVDFPDTQHEIGWACFAVDLERYLADAIEDFESTSRAVADEMGWRRKSPEVHAETLDRLGVEKLPPLLVQVPARVLALAADAAQPSEDTAPASELKQAPSPAENLFDSAVD